MKKIKQFDMKFVCESGNYKLEGCKNIPTLEQHSDIGTIREINRKP